MKCTVTIQSNDDAFSEDARAETARILRELAQRLEDGSETAAGLYDVNGNRCGRFTFAESGR